VGAGVGIAVGASADVAVGAEVGTAVGVGDGVAVGADVGTAVGAGSGFPPQAIAKNSVPDISEDASANFSTWFRLITIVKCLAFVA
jgi:hypothetical protein